MPRVAVLTGFEPATLSRMDFKSIALTTRPQHRYLPLGFEPRSLESKPRVMTSTLRERPAPGRCPSGTHAGTRTQITRMETLCPALGRRMCVAHLGEPGIEPGDSRWQRLMLPLHHSPQNEHVIMIHSSCVTRVCVRHERFELSTFRTGI